MPDGIFAAAWVAMAAGYTYSGYTKLISPSWVDGTAFLHLLNNPLARPSPVTRIAANLPLAMLNIATWSALATELLFAPLALFGRLRPILWTIMLVMHFSLILIVDLADLSLGMVMLHAFTFDPSWVRTRKPQTKPDVIFYDGECGLCHGAVRFVLSEDRTNAFRFAPLQSEAFEPVRALITGEVPDSLFAQTASGEVLNKSDSVCRILERLGGIWALIGAILVRLPQVLRDGAYDWVAAHRKRIFGTPASTCPLVPQHLRARFL
jgi:predicted DCC family thiol-disulfide oxidoreductase YuxK